MAKDEDDEHYSAPISTGVKVSAGTTQKGPLDGLEVVVMSFPGFPERDIALPIDVARFLAFQLFIELGLCHGDKESFETLTSLHATGSLRGHCKTLRELGLVELADTLDKLELDTGGEEWEPSGG